MTERHRKNWTGAEIERLKAMIEAGASSEDMAAAFGRSIVSIRQKRYELRYETMDKPPVHIKIRRCMCCSVKFRSWGPGNRLCVSCRHKDGTIVSQAAG